MLISLIIFLFAVLVLLPVALAWKSFAPWVPTRNRDIDRIFALANLKKGQVFYDLGSGDGKMLIYASQKFGASAVGIEAAFPLVIVSRLRQFFGQNKGIKIKWKSLFRQNLAEADVVYIFGTQGTLDQSFQAKLTAELKPGAKVISYAFSIGDLKPALVSRPSDKHLPIYVYEF